MNVQHQNPNTLKSDLLLLGSSLFAGSMLTALIVFRDRVPEVDWMDPENAPPAFGEEKPHPYRDIMLRNGQEIKTPCCCECGGGRKHPIHPQ